MRGKMYRSRSDRMLAGVCGGLAAYLGISSAIVRLVFLLLAFGDGVGVLLYLLLWVIMPYQGQVDVTSAGPVEMFDRVRTMGNDVQGALRTPHPQTGMVVGAALVIAGLVYLLRNLHLFPFWLDFGIFWPLLLILAGAVLIWQRTRGD